MANSTRFSVWLHRPDSIGQWLIGFLDMEERRLALENAGRVKFQEVFGVPVPEDETKVARLCCSRVHTKKETHHETTL